MEIKTTKQIQYMKPDGNWFKKWIAVDDLIKRIVSIGAREGTLLDLYEELNSQTNDKTLKGLKEFREKNWDKKLSRDKAYKKYINTSNNENKNKGDDLTWTRENKIPDQVLDKLDKKEPRLRSGAFEKIN